MPKNPFQIVRQVPGFAGTLARKPRLVASVLRQRALGGLLAATGRALWRTVLAP